MPQLAQAITALLLIVGAALSEPNHATASGRSLAVIHDTNIALRATWSCQDQIGQRHTPSHFTYAKTDSMPYRRWALRLWRGRLKACRPEARRVGVPPWFRNVMMCIHPKESSDWYLNGHHEGGLQYAHSTWVSAGGLRFAPHAYEATPNEQIRAAWELTDGSIRALSWHWAQTISGCL